MVVSTKYCGWKRFEGTRRPSRSSSMRSPAPLLQVYLIEQSIGFGYGSLLFHIGGVLLLAGQSRERFLRPQEKGPAEQQQIQATV